VVDLGEVELRRVFATKTVGKLSSGIGPPLRWGGTIWLLHEQGPASLLDASRVALGALALAALAGLWVLRPLVDAQRYPDAWEGAEA
jgi:hypothetical protein